MTKRISNSKCLILLTVLLFTISCSNKNPLDSDTTALEAIGWVKQLSPVEGAKFAAVDFVNEKHGWIVGDSGIILSTNNGGVQWSEQESGTIERLMDVDFINQSIGWVVGHNGTILKTIDGGKSWITQESGTTSKLEEITFLDSQIGWIAGRRDFVLLRTTDGGQHWNQDSIPEFIMLSDFKFVDEKKGTGIFNLHETVSTNDGGLTWTVLSEFNSTYIWGMDFLDKEYGLIVSSKYGLLDEYYDWYDIVYESLDGGQSWSEIHKNRSNMLFGKIFVQSRTSVFVLSWSFIQHSSDGGVTWTIQNADNPADVTDAVFLNDQIGWAVSWDGIILHTTNGGVAPSK